MIELRSLRHACALAEHGNFRKAAQALNLTQPALSHSIADLESGLRVRLFHRGKGPVAATAIGKLLLERSASLLKDARELEREINLKKDPEIGELTVGAGLFPAEISAGKALGSLLHSYPHLRMRMVVSDWRNVTRDVPSWPRCAGSKPS
jgi:DNA-binding transcriptional LysR family regulator